MSKLLALLTLVIFASAASPALAQRLAGGPGALTFEQRIDGAPLGASAYRIRYRSTGLNGEPIEVSGTVIVPAGAVGGGRTPVVAWAHPTTGIGPECAPSLAPYKFLQIAGLLDMLGRGYIIAATDYPGLGTAGPHPYLVGVSEGRAVLDSVKAAERLAGDVGAPFAVWGHSQGGQAALYAGLLARSYAPELHLVGVAAAAPPTELGSLLRYAQQSPIGRSLLAMTLSSWSQVYGIPLGDVMDPATLRTIDRLSHYCLDTAAGIAGWAPASQSLRANFVDVGALASIEPWRMLIARNSLAVLPRGTPVFIAQGTVDDLVSPQVTANYFARLCAARVPATLMMMRGVGHAVSGLVSANAAIDCIGARFAGAQSTSNCGAYSN